MSFSFFPFGAPSFWKRPPWSWNVDNLVLHQEKHSASSGRQGISGLQGTCFRSGREPWGNGGSPTAHDGKHCPFHCLHTALSIQQASYPPLQKQVFLYICAVRVQKVPGKSTNNLVVMCSQTPLHAPRVTALLGRLYTLMGFFHTSNRFFMPGLFLLCIFPAIPGGFRAL